MVSGPAVALSTIGALLLAGIPMVSFRGPAIPRDKTGAGAGRRRFTLALTQPPHIFVRLTSQWCCSFRLERAAFFYWRGLGTEEDDDAAQPSGCRQSRDRNCVYNRTSLGGGG